MDYRDFNIDIRSSKTSGEVQCLCPQCSHTRKKKNDKCLSVNLDKQSWFCHHCGWKGKLLEKIEKIKTAFVAKKLPQRTGTTMFLFKHKQAIAYFLIRLKQCCNKMMISVLLLFIVEDLLR